VVTRISESKPTVLHIDGIRGPSPLPKDVEDRLSLLVERNGLRISTDDTSHVQALHVTDAAELALSSSSSSSSGGGIIVGALSGRDTRRSLCLISPISDAKRKQNNSKTATTLCEVAAADARRRMPVVACCASKLEAKLFALAWASAGGGDVESSRDVLYVRVFDSMDAAVDAAIVASGRTRETLAVVPVWCSTGAPAQRSATARIRAAFGGNDAAWRYVPYHASDDDRPSERLGRTLEEAPHQLHARAPTLRFGPVRLAGGSGAGSKLTLTLICAPTFVVLGEDAESDAERTTTLQAMAGRVAEALLYDANGAIDSDAASECAALAAHGAVLLPRTAEIIRASASRGEAILRASPYGRPAARVLEQFQSDDGVPTGGSDALGMSLLFSKGAIDGGDDVRGWERRRRVPSAEATRSSPSAPDAGGGRDMASATIELIPTRDVSESASLFFRTVRYDESGSGRGVVEATFRSGEAHVEGVSLRRGDRVILTKQERASEQNGAYVVIDERTMQCPVALAAPRSYTTALIAGRSADGGARGVTWSWRFSGFDDGGLGLRVGDEAAWLGAPGAPIGRVVNAADGSITIDVPAKSIVASPAASKFDRDWLHPLSKCSADARVPTRQLCAAKHPEAVWDRPCQRDADCPFLSSTSQYRGRCLASGRCEVPVGAELVGWRHAAVRPVRGERPVCACPQAASRLTLEGASEACCAGNGKSAVYQLDRV
jgi:hypothetical protein